MNKCTERLYNGIVKENPTFVLMLGMCPTLAVTTSAINGLGMGLSTTVVLMFSNMLIAALRKIIPDRVRIPAYIVIVATLVTIVQLLCAQLKCGSRYLYPVNRGKLYHPWPCRVLCIQEPGDGFYLRRNRYGSWFYHCPYSNRPCA